MLRRELGCDVLHPEEIVAVSDETDVACHEQEHIGPFITRLLRKSDRLDQEGDQV